MANNGLPEYLFAMQQQQQQMCEVERRRSMQDMMSPLAAAGQGLAQGLGFFGGVAFSSAIGSGKYVPMNQGAQSNDGPRPLYKPILTFIQTLRDEIDEWLKL